MYQSIVIAVDGSKTSYKAFQEAMKLAEAMKAKLSIVHVIDVTVPNSQDVGPLLVNLEQYQFSLRETGNELLKKMESLAVKKKIKAEGKLLEITDGSRISDKINEAMNSWKPDVLVLGTHGRRGFHRFLIGSVAEEVIRSSNIPVLLIRTLSDE